MGESRKIMATVRLNMSTINAETIETLSVYSQANVTLKALREEYKANSSKLESEKSEVLEKRKNALEQGQSVDEVSEEFSLVEVEKKISALKVAFNEECKPYKAEQKKALELLPIDLYYGYIYAIQKGSAAAKGDITLKKGKKTSIITIDRSYKDMIKDFFDSIGVSKTDNEKALSKAIGLLSNRANGVIKSSKGTEFVKVKSESQYKDLFMLSFLQTLVYDFKSFEMAEDGTLSLKVFE